MEGFKTDGVEENGSTLQLTYLVLGRGQHFARPNGGKPKGPMQDARRDGTNNHSCRVAKQRVLPKQGGRGNKRGGGRCETFSQKVKSGIPRFGSGLRSFDDSCGSDLVSCKISGEVAWSIRLEQSQL